MYHYTDGGLRNVWLANGYEEKNTPHGKAIVIRDLDGLIAAICKTLSRKNGPLTGTEFRYIRTSGLLLSQASLAKMLGVDAQTVARWEKTSRVPRWADQLTRVYYAAKSDGNEAIRRVVDRFDTVERLVKESIIVKESRSGWKTKIEKQGDLELAA